MALTRAQLLAGDTTTGTPVLNGQVQGVRQGVGVLINPDGTINFDASSALGVMRLNNGSAYNGYVWPSGATAPAAGTILQSDGTGALFWISNYVSTVGTTALNAAQGAARLPSGTIAQRPTAAAGLIRYNSELGVLEYNSGTAWIAVISASPTSPTIGLGLAVSGTAIKVSIPIQFGPPAAGTLPAQAIDGSMYWDDNLGVLFIRYNDGTSTQWVQVIPSGGGGGGSGTVTSVGLQPAASQPGIAVTGATSPITGAGTYFVAIDLNTLPPLP